MHTYIRHNYITIGYASQESRRSAQRGALAFLRSFPGSAQGLISLLCSVVHFNPAHPPPLRRPPPASRFSLPPSFRFVARRSFAGYTSRRAAGNGLTVGGEQLLPRKRFPSKLHLKNMIRLHSGGRAPDYHTDSVTSSSASSLFLFLSPLSLAAFSARERLLPLACGSSSSRAIRFSPSN